MGYTLRRGRAPQNKTAELFLSEQAGLETTVPQLSLGAADTTCFLGVFSHLLIPLAQAPSPETSLQPHLPALTPVFLIFYPGS